VPARGAGGGEAQDVEAPAAARGVGGGKDEDGEAPTDALGSEAAKRPRLLVASEAAKLTASKLAASGGEPVSTGVCVG
jgi:hypothetical protein